MRNRIKVNKTKEEWELINKKILSSGKSNFHSFMQSKISELDNKFKKCEECVTPATNGIKKERAHYVNSEMYRTLKLISIRMGISESTVIDRFIINPLLQPE